MQGLTDDKGKGKQLVLVKYFLYSVVDQPPNMIMSSDRGLVTALSPPENRVHFGQVNAVPEQVGCLFQRFTQRERVSRFRPVRAQHVFLPF
jgi:hypothetical protein